MYFKKILTVFLTAALFLSLLVVSVSANAERSEILKVEVEALTTTSTHSDNPIIYQPGQEFTVKLRASQNTGITSVMLYIDYDETAFSVVDSKYIANGLFTTNDLLSSNFTSKGDGYLVFLSDNYPNISNNTGVFAEITFIANEVCAKETAITVTPFQNSSGNCVVKTDSGLKEVPFESENAVFSIHDINTENSVVTSSTCTEQGYTTHICNSCNESVIGNYVEAAGHTNGEVVRENFNPPSCTKDGSYDSVVYCSTCKIELSRKNELITAPGHTKGEAVVENRVEATCTLDGSYDSVVYCSVCGIELSRERKVINSLNHDLKHIEAKAPNCTENGWNAYEYCQRCDYTTYSELAAKGHKYDGICDSICNVCEIARAEQEHTYENPFDAECNVCGLIREVNTEPTLYKDTDGKWYYYVGGVKSTESTLVKYSGKWFYVTNGVWDSSVNTLVKYSGKWFYIENGKWDSSVNTLVKYSGKWFYIKNGKWNSSVNTLVKYSGKWFYIKNGKWDSSATLIFEYNGKEFFIKNGKAQLDYSGKVNISGKTYTIKGGKVV